MTRPVKSWIGLISSKSSRRPCSMNQRNESSCSSIRFGIGWTSGMRAYRLRSGASGALRDESATDSMNRSLAEGEEGGAALTERAGYHTSLRRHPRGASGHHETRPDPARTGSRTGRATGPCGRPRGPLLDLDLGALLPESGPDLLRLFLRHAPLDRLGRGGRGRRGGGDAVTFLELLDEPRELEDGHAVDRLEDLLLRERSHVTDLL